MNSRQEEIRKWLDDSIETRRNLVSMIPEIEKAADMIVGSIRNNGKVLLCGNGGSAADCQHIAAEFVNKLRLDRKPLPAISLATDTSNLTSIGNDYGFSEVFMKQVQALGKEGDVLIAISTSGNSENAIKAADAARSAGMHVIGLTGQSGGRLAEKCTLCIKAPSDDTQRIQEAHMFIYHSICELVENAFFR